jgi:ribonuclease HI
MDTNSICVYIDGSCSNNGKNNAKAGYGVFFEFEDQRNENGVVNGKQTNNTGELTAFIRAIEILKEEINEKKKINIYTDSEYVIKCAGSYSDKLQKNNWKTSTDKIPPNLKLLQKIYDLYKPNTSTINLFHIKAHTNLSDKHSIGNREADRLANMAICTEEEMIFKESMHSNKNYINIAYMYKDVIKKLGAKWDINKKKWYYDDNISEDNIKSIKEIEILSETKKVNDESCEGNEEKNNSENNSKIYIKIPFKNKDSVKKLGGRWDPEKKSWYYLSTLDENKIKDIMKLT